MADKRGPKKPRTPAPKAYLIKVAVDSYGNFAYTADGIADASIVHPTVGDTISWSLTWNGIPVPFQVEFPGFGPFAGGVRVVRSAFLPTTPITVSVPSFYNLNFAFKYTVSTVNGWSDDPIVVPVPSDGIIIAVAGAQVITLNVDNNGILTLNPTDASFSKGEVTWQWAAGTQFPVDFTVTFDSTKKPPSWPPSASSNGAQMVTLNLQEAGNSVPYTLTPQVGSSSYGTLTIG